MRLNGCYSARSVETIGVRTASHTAASAAIAVLLFLFPGAILGLAGQLVGGAP